VEGYKALQALDSMYYNLHELARATGLSPQKISQDFQAYEVRAKLRSFGIEISSDLMPTHERRQRGEVLPEYHAVLVYQAVNALVAKGVIPEAAVDEEMCRLAKQVAPLPQAEAKAYIEAVKGRQAHPTDPASQPVEGDLTRLSQFQPAAASHGEDGGQVTCACCDQALTLIHYGDGDHQVKRYAMHPETHPENQPELPDFSP